MKYTKEMLEPIVRDSKSVSEVMKKLGLTSIGGQSHKLMSAAIVRFGLDRSHFINGGTANGLMVKKHWTERLVDGKRCQSNLLRRALLESGRPYKCEKCSCDPIWLDEPLTLQIDHKNGNDADNRPENVRFLCPNCHSQTPTHSKVKCSVARRCQCGNKSKSGRCLKCLRVDITSLSKIPSKALLRELIWQYPATTIAKQFGVSDKAVDKWCKKYGISKPGPGYWMKNKSQCVV